MGHALRGGTPRGLPSNDRSPRGRAVRPAVNPGVGGVPLDRGLKLPAVIVNVRPSFRAARDMVRLARALNVEVRPVGNPVAPDGGFVDAGGKAEPTESAGTVTYHDAYELVGPAVALARLCAHPAVYASRGWVLPLNVRPGPRASGAGPLPEPVVKRLRAAARERADRAHDARVEAEKLREGWGADWLPNPVPVGRTATFREWRERLAASRAGKPRVEDTGAGAPE